MSPFRLAFSLLLIPKLFLSLIFFPLLISLFIVYLQLVATEIAITAMDRSSNSSALEKAIDERQNDNFVRKIIYGDSRPLAPIAVCRWHTTATPDGKIVEAPIDEVACAPNRLDVALHLKNPGDDVIARYVAILDGNVEKLHICSSCTPDIVITEQQGKVTTDIKSVWGLMVLGLVALDKDVTKHYVTSLRQTEAVWELVGKRVLHIGGLAEPITLNKIETRSIVIMNIAGLLIIALWLALKAHRKVLDYFARSGALLPMVAATGKGKFYFAIWILTMMRVGAFLLAAVPITIDTLARLLPSEKLRMHLMFGNNMGALLLWFLTVISALCFATIIASIGELKQRHQIFSFVYRYLPVMACALGALVWLASFIIEGSGSELLRQTLTALPVIGVGPVLIAPIVKPHTFLLLIHLVLTASLLIFSLKRNAHWFAAHLEDL